MARTLLRCRRRGGHGCGSAEPIHGLLSDSLGFVFPGSLRGQNQGGLAIVVGDQLGEGVLSAGSRSLEPGCGRRMESPALGTGEGLVRDLADKNVSEREGVAPR